jgi:hypothetical protein
MIEFFIHYLYSVNIYKKTNSIFFVLVSQEERASQRVTLHKRKPMSNEGYNLHLYSKERYDYMYNVCIKMVPTYYTKV